MSEYTPTEARICIDFCNAATKRAQPDGSFLSMEEADAAFSRWLAAHDAEVRAAVSVGSGGPCQHVTEEPEWEYGVKPYPANDDVYQMGEAAARAATERAPGAYMLMRRTKAGPAGAWVPVKQEGADQ